MGDVASRVGLVEQGPTRGGFLCIPDVESDQIDPHFIARNTNVRIEASLASMAALDASQSFDALLNQPSIGVGPRTRDEL